MRCLSVSQGHVARKETSPLWGSHRPQQPGESISNEAPMSERTHKQSRREDLQPRVTSGTSLACVPFFEKVYIAAGIAKVLRDNGQAVTRATKVKPKFRCSRHQAPGPKTEMAAWARDLCCSILWPSCRKFCGKACLPRLLRMDMLDWFPTMSSRFSTSA